MLIITVMLLSIVVGLVIVSASSAAYIARTSTLAELFQAQSREAARACAQLVALRLATAQHYEGGQQWAIGEYRCQVGAVVASSTHADVTVSVSVERSKAAYAVQLELTPFSIISITQL